MENLSPAGEFLRISKHYRRMTDDELLALARQTTELTPIAQEALANAISERRLKVEPEEPPAPAKPTPKRGPAEPDPYDEDRQLVELCTVWSLADALQVQNLLDIAGIPFFMGQEKATSVDRVTSRFSDGVSVQVMSIGLPWARIAMEDYTPRNNPPPESTQEPDAPRVRCPKCHSAEVIFEQLVRSPDAAASPSLPKYRWICDSCGHEWEDDGIAKDK
jgi:DNA-directed RNA polymerase subunit M/transcription elongation factor TFIIS